MTKATAYKVYNPATRETRYYVETATRYYNEMVEGMTPYEWVKEATTEYATYEAAKAAAKKENAAYMK